MRWITFTEWYAMTPAERGLLVAAEGRVGVDLNPPKDDAQFDYEMEAHAQNITITDLVRGR